MLLMKTSLAKSVASVSCHAIVDNKVHLLLRKIGTSEFDSVVAFMVAIVTNYDSYIL